VYREGSDPLVLIDTLGITCPLLARLANSTGNRDLLNQAIIQVDNFWAHGFQASTGLPYHGYANNGQKSGIVGWARGVGWAALGLAQTIVFSGNDPEVRDHLAPKLEGLLRVVSTRQLEDGAFAWQLDATEGPTDSSATGMLTYATALSVDRGLVNSREFETLVAGGTRALFNVESSGVIRGASGECLGVGCYPQVFGEYPWGTAAALLAASVADMSKWTNTEDSRA